MTAPKKDPAEGLTAGFKFGVDQSQEDVKRSRRDIHVEACLLDIESIKPRHEKVVGRPVVAAHVLRLAQSLTNETLVTACTVDCRCRLIAGAHRLTAALLLHTAPEDRPIVWARWIGRSPQSHELEHLQALPYQPDRWRQIPVRVLIDVDSETDPARAIAAMAAENTLRKNMANEEVRQTIEALEAAGYSQRKGRPRKGDKPLRVALQETLGISERHAKRLLDEHQKSTPASGPDPTTIKRQVNRINKAIEKLRQQLRRVGSSGLPQTTLLLDRLDAAMDNAEAAAIDELSSLSEEGPT